MGRTRLEEEVMPRPITTEGRKSFREFCEAVWEMRALQREALATPAKDRPPDLVRRAREAEHRVDRLLVGRPEPAPRERLSPR